MHNNARIVEDRYNVAQFAFLGGGRLGTKRLVRVRCDDLLTLTQFV
jgi:hypothetical protein